MTIWIFALLLIASTTGLAWKYGAIRAGFAFAGILFGSLLATVIAPLLRPLLSLVGVKNPLTLWILGMLIGFLLIWVLFKIAA
jgi:hypothetical protein